MNGKILTILVAVVVVGSAIFMVADELMGPEGEFKVVDDRGVAYYFDNPPERIATLGKPFTQLFYDMGAQDKIVAVDSYSLDYVEQYPELEDLSIKSSIFSPDMESLIMKSPELIITYNYPSVKSKIEELEKHVCPVLAFYPPGYVEVMDMITKLGIVAGKTEAAGEIYDRMNDAKEVAFSRFSHLTEEQKPGVYFELASMGGSAVNIGSIGHSLIVLAGGINVAENSELGATYLIREKDQIMIWGPQIIIVEYSHELSDQDVEDEYTYSTQNPIIYRFSHGFNTYNQDLILGLQEMSDLVQRYIDENQL